MICELYVCYGDGHIPRETFFAVLMELKVLSSVPGDLYPLFLHSDLSRRQIMRHIEEALDFLQATMDEIDFEFVYNKFNHTPWFPYWVLGATDTVPVASCTGAT